MKTNALYQMRCKNCAFARRVGVAVVAPFYIIISFVY